jgi:hypothetical protein
MGISTFINIILLVLCIVIFYILYYIIKAKQSIVYQNYLGNGLHPVPITQLKNYQSNTYFYEVWICVNSVNKTQPAPTTSTTSLAANNNLFGNIFYVTNSISLDIYNNTSLHVNINNASSSYNTYTITKEFPLQKWQQVIISVNNYLMDLYLNGKLVKSIELTSSNAISPANSNTKIMFGTSDIYIAKLNRLTSVMNTQTAWNRYIQGNAGLIPIHANLTLTSDGSKTSKYDLF